MKFIRNNVRANKFIVVDDKYYNVNPFEVAAFEDKIADAFVAAHAGSVSIENEQNKVIVPSYLGPRTWLANVTGDPSHENPAFHKAIPRAHKFAGGQVPDVEAKSGKPTVRNLPGEVFEVWPYQRLSFPKDVAQQILNRDSVTETPGMIIEAREPSAFEPNETWELMDIIFWCRMVDSSIKTPDPAAVEKGAFQETKQDLLSAAWSRVVNPVFTLPAQEALDAFKENHMRQLREQLAASDSVPEVDPNAPKKRGRPPGVKINKAAASSEPNL